MPKLLGEVEIAELLMVKRGTVGKWRDRGLLPDPDGLINAKPAWSEAKIVKWAAKTNRQIKQPVAD